MKALEITLYLVLVFCMFVIASWAREIQKRVRALETVVWLLSRGQVSAEIRRRLERF